MTLGDLGFVLASKSVARRNGEGSGRKTSTKNPNARMLFSAPFCVLPSAPGPQMPSKEPHSLYLYVIFDVFCTFLYFAAPGVNLIGG